MAESCRAVKWFNNAKCFGSLHRVEDNDVFIHYNSIQSEGYKLLQSGELVDFDGMQGEKA